MKQILRILLATLLLCVLAAVGLAWRLNREFAGFREEVIVNIPRGTGTSGIAKLLFRAGVVPTEWDFVLARMIRPGAKLQAGEYRFFRPASPLEVLGRIIDGDVHYYEVLVPEGSNLFDIASAVGRTGVISSQDFLQAAMDPGLVSDIAPAAASMEGFLYPDTYRFSRHTTPGELCGQMHRRFREIWAKLDPGGTPALSVLEAVTLASLVEKETGVADERPLVSSVIHNRLKLGIPLEIDPTVIYSALLENRYRGRIYRSDLDYEHPYNTYRNKGLPPGPIACPGRDAMSAALHPASTNYLFFVARPDSSGGHVFSETLAAHEKAVARYRRGLAENQ